MPGVILAPRNVGVIRRPRVTGGGGPFPSPEAIIIPRSPDRRHPADSCCRIDVELQRYAALLGEAGFAEASLG